MKHFDPYGFRHLVVELPEEIKFHKYSGDFEGELAAIDRYLDHPSLPENLVTRLEIERAIAELMLRDYLTDDDALIEFVRRTYPSFDADALEHCISTGHVDFILKNGERRYQRAAGRNILNNCSRYLTEHEGRVFVPEFNRFRHENADIMRKKGSRAFRFQVRISIKPTPEAERPGEMLRIHLPIAQPGQTQSDIRLISCSVDDPIVNECYQSSVFFETPCVPGKEYFAEFSYVNRSVYTELDDSIVLPQRTYPVLYKETMLPHIRFTPYLRALAREIVGDEENELIKARLIYNWITENVAYSYMRHYFCLENIAENAALNRRGDCGVQALLFITLCRIVDIPARWQGGCAVRPGYIGDHDWAMFYIRPYGWLYCDPSYGGGAYRSGDTELRDWYFGNLDCFRMVSAGLFGDRLYPDKYYMRRDPYDNQEGEIEYADRNLFWGEVESKQTLISAEELE